MTVFYRKYRPQKISDLDSEDIKQKLTAILSSKRLPHAFLLTGPRGLGKTSTARIIAKSYNCPHKDNKGEPCAECEVCKSIADGYNLDVLEIDAASNRGIDEIRDLREKIKLSPVKAKYKVYIIDEVHMLTAEAFNALLKTLEEPPKHAIFILCTTEKHKVPETIISRCTLLEFVSPSLSEMLSSLKKVVKKENIEIEEGVLEIIAKKARGSFRDAQKFLDQLNLTFTKLELKKVMNFFEGSREGSEEKFFKYLLSEKLEDLIKFIETEGKMGRDWKIWLEKLLNILHEGLLKRAANIEPENKDFDFKLLNNLSLKDYQVLIELFTKAYLDLKTALIQELPIEMAVIEWYGFKDNLKDMTDGSSGLLPEGQVGSITNKVFQTSQVKTVKSQPSVLKENSSLQNNNDLLKVWPEILKALRPVNHSVEALLRSARPLCIEDQCLTVEVFYKFHKERLEEPKIYEIISKIVPQVLSSVCRVKFVLGEKAKKNTFSADTDLIKAAKEIFG